ncbi:MAG: cation:proton antiporter [Candidatus Hadarchaeales archaeon]
MEAELSSLLLYLALILIAPKVGGAIFSRLKQPAVVGEIIAGILIGPSVAGWLSSQILGLPLCLDPSSPAGKVAGMLSQIGIILLLFLAGLSVDVKEFRKAGKPASVIAATGALTAFALGFGAASLFGWGLLEAAFAGGVLMATSVGITVRTLLEINELHSKPGIAILGAAVIDDVFGIIALTILAGVATASVSVLDVAQILALMAAFFLCAGIAGFRLIPKIITYLGRLRAEEVVLSGALAVTFIVSALAEKVHIAAITGAFLVGMMARKTPMGALLREKVSTVGYGFFIPIFFVLAGAEVDLPALLNVSLLAIGFLAIAMFDKILGCGGGALLSGFSPRDSLKVGVGMMPRAEVALIMASVGLQAGAVGQALYSMTVLVVLVTSIVSPVLVKFAFKRRNSY